MRSRANLWIVVPALLALAACTGQQSALDPQGPQAHRLADLIWIFTAIGAVIWLAVMAVLLSALIRRAPERPDPLALGIPTERRSVVAVALAATATLLIVIALTAVSYLSQRRVYAKETSSVVIKIT